MKHLFIINPVAGKGKALKLVPEIRELFTEMEDECFTVITEKPGHATEIARKFTNSEKLRVYSVGGDGTLNEVLNGMAGSGSSLAVIPAGSGNDFIRSLGAYDNASEVLYRTINGHEMPVDLATVNGKYFINISSIGFDAEVADSTSRLKKLPLVSGSTAYVLGIFAALVRSTNNVIKISFDDIVLETSVLLVAIANGKYYGGGMKAAPRAEIDDGLFDICLVDRISRHKILRLFHKYIVGEHEVFDFVKFYKSKKVEITSKNPIMLNTDGEIQKVTKAVFEIIPKGINVVIPE